MHAADSSAGLVPLVSFVIWVPLGGCHNCGATYAVAWRIRDGELLENKN